MIFDSGLPSIRLSRSRRTIRVISEGSGDAIGGNQVIEGEKIQEQNIYLEHSEFRSLLWGQELGIAPEELQKLADEMEQTARSL